MGKIVYEESYKDCQIEINATYDDLYYDVYEKWTNAIKLHYVVKGKNGYVIKSSDDPEVVAKKKEHRFLFWTIKPKETFQEQVQKEIKWIVDMVKREIDRDIYEKEITDGLMDSLKNI